MAGSIAQAGESYIAVEAHSGRIVLELDADQKRPVASLTKIATAMVVLDWAHLSQTQMGQIAVVPAGAAAIGGSNPMGLIPGDQIALREAMYSMLLGSDNVSALTLATHVGRSIQAQSRLGGTPTAAFVGEMNNLARVLGMRKTRFSRPSGTGFDGAKGTFDRSRHGPAVHLRDAGHRISILRKAKAADYFFVTLRSEPWIQGQQYPQAFGNRWHQRDDNRDVTICRVLCRHEFREKAHREEVGNRRDKTDAAPDDRHRAGKRRSVWPHQRAFISGMGTL